MNPQDIKAFLAITEHKSISAAAKALFTTQPTISSHLARLEKELEKQLIYRERGARNVILTPAGKAFVPLAQKWAALERETLRFKTESPTIALRIGASIDGYEHIVVHAMKRLKELIPTLDLQFHVIERAVAHTALMNQEIDAYFSLGLISESPFICKVPLFTEDRYLLCRTDSTFPEGTIPAKQLDPSYEIALLKAYAPLEEWHRQNIRKTDSPYFQVDNQMILYHFLTDPKCWAICPASIVSKLIHNEPNRISYRMISPAVPPRYCSLLFLHSFPAMELISTLYDALRKYAEEVPYLHPESYPDHHF